MVGEPRLEQHEQEKAARDRCGNQKNDFERHRKIRVRVYLGGLSGNTSLTRIWGTGCSALSAR